MDKDICQFSEEINALEYQLTTSVKALAKTAIARAGLAAELEAANQRIAELEGALNNLLNDCINFDGGKLTDVIMSEASSALKSEQ